MVSLYKSLFDSGSCIQKLQWSSKKFVEWFGSRKKGGEGARRFFYFILFFILGASIDGDFLGTGWVQWVGWGVWLLLGDGRGWWVDQCK